MNGDTSTRHGPPGAWARIAAYLRMERGESAIPELDGLRALAILLVLLRHGVRPFWSAEESLLPVGWWDAAVPAINGWAGVDLFFVLSGFLIAHHVMRRYLRPDGRFDVRDYVWRRALRIVPAYWAVLLVVAAGLVPGLVVEPANLGRRVTYHLAFLQDYLPSDILVTFWSLGVEEKFYLLAPVLLLLVLKLPRPGHQRLAVAGLVVLPLLGRLVVDLALPDVRDYDTFFRTFRSPFHASLDGLAVGVLCALLYRDRGDFTWAGGPRVPRALFWAGTALVATLLLPTPLLDPIGAFDRVPLQALLALGFGGMLLGTALGGSPRGLLSGQGLHVISKLAYSLYLVHHAVIPGTSSMLTTWAWFADLSRTGQLVVFLPAFLLVSLAAAAAVHYVVEKPFLLLRDRRPLSVSAGRAVLAS